MERVQGRTHRSAEEGGKALSNFPGELSEGLHLLPRGVGSCGWPRIDLLTRFRGSWDPRNKEEALQHFLICWSAFPASS